MKPIRSIAIVLPVLWFAWVLPLPSAASMPAPPDTARLRAVLRYVAPDRADPVQLLLRREDDRLVLRDGGAIVASRSLDQVAAVSIGGPDRTDTELTVDYSGGDIAQPIDFHPGALGPSTVNALTLAGGSATTMSHRAVGPHDGVIERDGAIIRYANLTPLTDTAPSITVTFSVPATAFVINIVDGPAGTTQINDGGTAKFESYSFANKQTVVINAAANGSTFTVANPSPAAGLTRLVLAASGGSTNAFSIRPYASIPVTVRGNVSINSHNDVLAIDATGATTPALAVNSNAFGYVGAYTFGNRAPVGFQSISSYSPSFVPPCSLDVDGNGQVEALNDGLILLRAMFLLTGPTVTNNALGTGAVRNTWDLIRAYLNGNCGANFSP